MKLPPVLVVIALLFGAACGGGDERGYSPRVERNFVGACIEKAIEVSGGVAIEEAARQSCSCVYDEVVASVPFEEFAESEQQARENKDAPLPPSIEAAGARCRAEQGYSEVYELVFVDVCVESAVDEGVSRAQGVAFCRCTFGEIKTKVPFEEYNRYDMKARTNPSTEPPPKVAAAIERCAESLG